MEEHDDDVDDEVDDDVDDDDETLLLPTELSTTLLI